MALVYNVTVLLPCEINNENPSDERETLITPRKLSLATKYFTIFFFVTEFQNNFTAKLGEKTGQFEHFLASSCSKCPSCWAQYDEYVWAPCWVLLRLVGPFENYHQHRPTAINYEKYGMA